MLSITLMLGLIVCLLAGTALATGAGDGQGNPKDVYIDNTVDNSVAIVIGRLQLTNTVTGAVSAEEVYREQVKTAYHSEPVVTADVQQMIVAAGSALKQYAADSGYAVADDSMTVNSANGKVWDNRKYETVENNDAALIGDADYLQGAYGGNSEYTRTHVASGEYGIEHIFTVTLNAQTDGTVLITGVSITVDPPAAGQKRLSSDPAVTIAAGQGYRLTGTGWLEKGGGMSTQDEDYTFEMGQTYYRTIYLEAEEGFAFKSGSPATGNYETRFNLDGTCDITGGELYVTAIRGDALSGTEMTVVVKVQPAEAKEYTVTVTTNGYMGKAGASPASGVPGTQVTLTATPESGYRFKEWQVVSGGVTVTGNQFTIGTENVEIQAVFEDNTVGIALGATAGGSYAIASEMGNVYSPQIGGDGSIGSMNISTVSGDKLTLTAAAAEGYVFKGWYEGKIGASSFVEAPADTLISASAAYTFTAAQHQALCAVFEQKEVYTVSFDANGGTGRMEEVSVQAGEKLTLPPNGFSAPASQVFDAWDAGAPGTQIDVTGNRTVKAIWKEQAAAPIAYTYTQGEGAAWTKGSGVPLDFIVQGSREDQDTFAKFTGIEVDGAAVAAENYNAAAGSVKISLNAGYLETLAVGSHGITARFSDGSAKAGFTVAKAAQATGTEQPTATPGPAATEAPAETEKPAETAQPAHPAVPAVSGDDSGYDFKFTFTKKWQGDREKSINWVLYRPDGTVAHKKFNKKIVSEDEWRYEAWFASGADYYIVENVPAGYRVRYENVGAHAGETDRCYNGGTIINYKLPKTGDTAQPRLWTGLALLGMSALCGMLIADKRRKARR